MKRLVFVLLVFALASCAEEMEILTPGEINGREIQRLTSEARIETATIFFWREIEWIQVNQGSFTISGQFLIIENTYYDLNTMHRFTILPSSERVSVYFN